MGRTQCCRCQAASDSVASSLDHTDIVFSLTQAYFKLSCLDAIGVSRGYSLERESDANGVLGLDYTSVKNAALLTPSHAVFYRVKCFHIFFNAIPLGETTRALQTPH